jgi:glycosyltransferase involved in cell wall biosynthesis
MSNTPILSIILCTYNNADSLAITLKQLVHCDVSDWVEIEILVIDNNSTDHTAEAVREVSSISLVPLEYCFEQEQGLSNARNHGIRKAKGDYLLFTDDDADIPVNWLSSYLHEIRSTQADCLFSKIEIIWDRDPPWWFDKRYNPYFVHLDYGEKKLWITDIHHEFFGKNFCCKKSVLESMGGFDEQLGRKGASLAAGEETIIYRQLVKQGAQVVYFPDTAVGHRLKPIEYTPANIKKKFVDGASSSLKIAHSFSTKRLLGRSLYPLKVSIITTFKSLIFISISALSIKENSKRDVFFHMLQLKRSLQTIKLWIVMP